MNRRNSRAGFAIGAPLLASIFIVGLVACGPEADSGNAVNLTAGAEPALPAKAKLPKAAPTEAAATSAVVLEGNGLTLVERDGGASRPIAFDASMTDTVQALTRALGGPPDVRGTNEECGAGSQDFAEWKGVIILWFAEKRFVGWESKGGLRTADGLGVGSRRSSMRQFQVEQSSLGTEFTGPSGLYGILESPAPRARITALWAGSTCIFR